MQSVLLANEIKLQELYFFVLWCSNKFPEINVMNFSCSLETLVRKRNANISFFPRFLSSSSSSRSPAVPRRRRGPEDDQREAKTSQAQHLKAK